MDERNKKIATAEIIAVGNELLIGKTLDTNTNWLTKRLTELGIYVKRAMIVRDNLEDIAEAVNLALKSATFIVITGGLGPTEDDLTLRALAKALDKDLELSEEALKMVEQRYEHFYRQGFVELPELTPEREKMAMIPKGATPIFNTVGAAPGVLINYGNVFLLALPGVPKEMQAIFDKVINDVITKIGCLEGVEIEEIIVDIGDESKIAPILKLIQNKISGVFLKSVATYFDKEVKIKIRIMAYGENTEDRINKINKVKKLLRAKYNIKILERVV